MVERTPLDVCGRALDRGRVESEALKPREACRPAAELAAEAGLFKRGADAGRPSLGSEAAEFRALLCSVNRMARMLGAARAAVSGSCVAKRFDKSEG